MKPLVVSKPVTHSPIGPDFLHWVMEQCRLQLNKHGGLVPVNPDSPDISPSATLGFRAIRALPPGLDLEMAGKLHHALVTQLRGEIQETGSPAPLVAAAFSLSPSLRVGLYSLSPPVTLARPSKQLEVIRSKSSQVFLSGLWSSQIGHIVWVDVMLRVEFCYRTKQEMPSFNNLILQLKGGVWMKPEKQLR